MILIVCLDVRDGILFNHRRQSSDRCVVERILQMSRERKLYVQAGSAALFPEKQCIVSDQLLKLAEPGDVCFYEDAAILPYLDKIEKLIIFRWDKLYPSDVQFPVATVVTGLPRKTVSTFTGNSHDLITQEVYER